MVLIQAKPHMITLSDSAQEHFSKLVAQQGMKGLGRAGLPAQDDDQPAAVKERAPDLPDGEIEGIGVEKGPDIVLVKLEPLIRRAEQPHHIPMFNHHPFRRTGRARGVDYVSQMMRFDCLF